MPALDDAQLAALAALLGYPVPPEYVAFMATYPPVLAAKHYPGLTRGIAEHELFSDPARVVAANHRVRTHPTWGADGEQFWTPSHLVIGTDLSGDMIFIDSSSAAAPIQRYLVETGATITVAPDVATYAALLVNDDPSLRRS